MASEAPSRPTRYQNLYAHHLWQQQRFFAGLLLVVGLGASGLALYRGQLFTPGFAVWIVSPAPTITFHRGAGVSTIGQ